MFLLFPASRYKGAQNAKLATVVNFVDKTSRLVPTNEPIERLEMSSSSEDQKIREWQKDVVKSIADDTSTTTAREIPQTRSQTLPVRSYAPTAKTTTSNASPTRPMVVNQIVTHPPPVVVTRVKAPEPKPSEEISTKAMIGTVVGATAGAFIAFAMVKGSSEEAQPIKAQERITYRTIQAPPNYNVTRIPIEDTRSHHNPIIRTIDPPPAKAETLLSASDRSRHPESHSDTRGYKVVSRDGPIVMIDNDQATPRSHAPSTHPPSKSQVATSLPPSSAPVTEVRIARDVPLPSRSQASHYTRTTIKDPEPRPTTSITSKPLPSVVPDDSISQASTRRSKDSGRSKHHRSSHHSHRDHRRDGYSRSGRERGTGGGSGSKVEDMVGDVVGIFKGTSVRGSERRSVRA